MLCSDIAIRGAISHGLVFRSRTQGGTFIAGRAIVDAYRFEQSQDWVGVMLAPSAIQRIPSLADRCRLASETSAEGTQKDVAKLNLAGFLQRARIPFHRENAQSERTIDGYAVVPTGGDADSAKLSESVGIGLQKLEWLKLLAPSPDAQAKYEHTINWLKPVHETLRGIAKRVIKHAGDNKNI